MKKLNILLIWVSALMLFAPTVVSAQLEWSKSTISSPDAEGIRAVLIRNNGEIFAFNSDGKYFISNDGVVWNSFESPYQMGIVQEVIEDHNLVYVASTTGIFTWNNQYWDKELNGQFFGLVSTPTALLAVGKEAYCKYGSYWIQRFSLQNFLTDEYAVFSAAAAIDGKLVAFMNDNDSSSQNTTPIVSIDEGVTWAAESTLPLSVATDATMASNGEYSAVGLLSTSPAMLRSVGHYQFQLASGSLYTALYFQGTYWTGGYYGNNFPSDSGAMGIIIPDGHMDQAYVADSPIEDLSENGAKIVAVDRLGGVYMADSGTAGIADQPPQMSVYPNPTVDVIKFSVQTESQITVYATTGKILMTSKMPKGENQIDLSVYPTGMYILQIDNDRVKVLKR